MKSLECRFAYDGRVVMWIWKYDDTSLTAASGMLSYELATSTAGTRSPRQYGIAPTLRLPYSRCGCIILSTAILCNDAESCYIAP
jgi:hypothetical protein